MPADTDRIRDAARRSEIGPSGVREIRCGRGMHSADSLDCARRRSPMRQRQIEPVSTRLLKVGLEVFPVYGDERSGWSMDPIDLTPDTPKWLRYDSLDELFFALLNLNVTPEGQA
jgi:hypothetical protein